MESRPRSRNGAPVWEPGSERRLTILFRWNLNRLVCFFIQKFRISRSISNLFLFFFKDGLHYDCVSIQQPPVKPAADEDGYIIPMRMKSSPSFSSVSTSSASPSQRHSLTSFHPPQEGQPPPRRRSGVRQSRQDLHVKLEDHYGTVTGANFQALAQLLEQVIYHSSFINEACKKILPRLLRNSSYTLDCRRLARDHWRPTFTSWDASRVKIWSGTSLAIIGRSWGRPAWRWCRAVGKTTTSFSLSTMTPIKKWPTIKRRSPSRPSSILRDKFRHLFYLLTESKPVGWILWRHVTTRCLVNGFFFFTWQESKSFRLVKWPCWNSCRICWPWNWKETRRDFSTVSLSFCKSAGLSSGWSSKRGWPTAASNTKRLYFIVKIVKTPTGFCGCRRWPPTRRAQSKKRCPAASDFWLLCSQPNWRTSSRPSCSGTPTGCVSF